MSLRPPKLAVDLLAQSAADTLDAEILAEKASALGRTGRKVEMALEALRRAEATSPERPALVMAASQAVYEFFIQRELSGMRRHADAIERYAIPREVLARIGVSGRPSAG